MPVAESSEKKKKVHDYTTRGDDAKMWLHNKHKYAKLVAEKNLMSPQGLWRGEGWLRPLGLSCLCKGPSHTLPMTKDPHLPGGW